MQSGHEEGGGDAFAGDVGHDEHEFAASVGVIGGIERVVIIAGDGILRASIEGDFGIWNHRRSGGNEPSLDFAGDFEVALHGDFVGELEGEEKEKEKRSEELVLEFDSIVVDDLETETRGSEQAKGNEEQHAAGRGEFVHHGPEKLLDYGKRAPPAREFVYFVPIDILAVEAVAGAGVGGELRPEVVDATAIADALPKVAKSRSGSRPWFGSAGRRCWR